MEITPAAPAPRPLAPRAPAGTADAMRTAREFEAVFLAEMLKHSGLNAMPDSFGGGPGEDAFASLLTQEYARLLSERGGVGLSEAVYESMSGGGA